MEKFDYPKALAELEAIVSAAEDPATGLDALDAHLKRSEELIAQCREYLRTARAKADKLEETLKK